MTVAARCAGGDNNLAATLWEITPLGAPALLYCREQLTCPLPLTAPPPGRTGDRIVETLLRAQHRGRDVAMRDVLEVAYALDTGMRRTDGLPGWAHLAANALPPETPRVGIGINDRARRQGRPPKLVEKVAAAVESDIYSQALSDVSLALHWHDVEHDERPRSAERARRTGRELLAGIGAWPWAHAPNGRLCASWREERTYSAALSAWHARSCDELEQEARRARAGFRAGHLNAGA